MTHEQLREALRKLVDAIDAKANLKTNILRHGSVIAVADERRAVDQQWIEAVLRAREALAALEREGALNDAIAKFVESQQPIDPEIAKFMQEVDLWELYAGGNATPHAAERDVSGWAPELREIAAAIPQSVHDEVAREAAAEREGAALDQFNKWYDAQWWTKDIGRQACWSVWQAALAQGHADAQDAARLEWLISAIPRDTFCDVTGMLSSRDNMDENRAAIDKQRGAGEA